MENLFFWANNNVGILLLLLVFTFILFLLFYYIKNSSQLASNTFRSPLNIVVICMLLGSVIGFAFFTIASLTGYWTYIFLGSLIGLIFSGALLIAEPGFFGLRCKEVQLSIPQFGQMVFVVNDTSRHVAWSLFVEITTRISTQPLETNQGNLREAINSLHSLFSTTRDLLKSMEPSKEEANKTVEMYAINMLNKILRPFLSKWHPLLMEFEKQSQSQSDYNWEYNEAFRKNLENIRKELIDYAKGFGQLAGVKDIDFYFKE